MCKHREMFSLAVLIGRGLVQVSLESSLHNKSLSNQFPPLFSFECTDKQYASGDQRYAPLAQLVEHLTLNQGVHGSSP